VPSGEAIIMAHYPTERRSDLCLEQFIDFILRYNETVEGILQQQKAVGDDFLNAPVGPLSPAGTPISRRKRRPSGGSPITAIARASISSSVGAPTTSVGATSSRDIPDDDSDLSTEDEAAAFADELDIELDIAASQPFLPSCVGSRKATVHRQQPKKQRPLASVRKGVKLDFKLWSCVEPTLRYLRKIRAAERMRGHLWLNADVFAGPGSLTSPLDAHKFVSLCGELLPEAVLSLGWGSTMLSTTRLYTAEMIDRMIELCMYPIVRYRPRDPNADPDADPQPSGSEEPIVIAPAAACCHITFAVAAEYALASAPELRRLLDTVPSTTLTIYSGVGSLGVTPQTVQDFVKAFGKSRCFFDLKVSKPWRNWFFGGGSPARAPPTPSAGKSQEKERVADSPTKGRGYPGGSSPVQYVSSQPPKGLVAIV